MKSTSEDKNKRLAYAIEIARKKTYDRLIDAIDSRPVNIELIKSLASKLKYLSK
jgi:NAD-dependent DNA ligase